MNETDKARWLAMVAAYTGAAATARWYVTMLNDDDEVQDEDTLQEYVDEASGAVATLNALRQRIARFAHTLMRQHGAGSPYYEALYQAFDTVDAELANVSFPDGTTSIALRGSECEEVYAEVSNLLTTEGE